MKSLQPSWSRARLAFAITLATCSGTAAAVTFQIGEIEGQFDSNLSVGASWALRNPDPDLLHDPASDDGRRNFKKGETFSKVLKGIHDLELKYGESGMFVRGKYWYDLELKDEGRPFKDIEDHNRKEAAQSSGAELLDAFLYHNYQIGDLPGTTRLGRQVDSINPVDVAAFRRPGAEVKEGLIPVSMLYLSQGITEEVSVEGFYQLEWDQTVIDNCGTFFAPVDVVADGCEGLDTPSAPPFPGPATATPGTVANGGGITLVRRRAGQRIRRLLHQLPQPAALLQHAKRDLSWRPEHLQVLHRVPRGYSPLRPELQHHAQHRHHAGRRDQLSSRHAGADQPGGSHRNLFRRFGTEPGAVATAWTSTAIPAALAQDACCRSSVPPLHGAHCMKCCIADTGPS